MHIYFCLRRDACSKKGGDSLKVDRYVDGLARIGVSSSVFNSPSELPDKPEIGGVVHIFNTQVPFENLRYFKWAKKNNFHLIFSTIHHSHYYTDKYHCDGFLKKIIGLSLLTYIQALAKELIVYRTLDNISSFLFSPNNINKKLIDESRYVLPLSLQEKEHLENDFDIVVKKGDFGIIQNGITYDACHLNPCRDREIDVLVVGRVEPRKNQVKLAKILSMTDYKVVFVGAENDNHARYFDSFVDTVNAGKNLSYVGKKDYDELQEIYLNAKVSLSNSYFEVVSQVDLEAVTLGCKPIVSEGSAIFDYFQGDVLSLHPDCTASDVLLQLQNAFSSAYAPSLKDSYYLSWAQVVDKLSKIYARCIPFS